MQHVHIIPTIIVIPPHPAREPVIHHHRPALGDIGAVLRLGRVQRQRAHFDGAGLGVDERRHAEALVEKVQGWDGEAVEDDGEEDEEVDGCGRVRWGRKGGEEGGTGGRRRGGRTGAEGAEEVGFFGVGGVELGEEVARVFEVEDCSDSCGEKR